MRYKREQQRKLLREYLTNFTDRQYGDIESRMFKRGFKHPTKKEMLIYNYLGEELFNKLIQSVGRYTFLEAEYLKLNAVTEKDAFRQMNMVNLESMCDSLISQLPILVNSDEIHWQEVSDGEMLVKIREKYKSSKPTLLLKS